MNRDDVWTELARRKVDLVKVEYSGGNDEGGVEVICFYQLSVTGNEQMVGVLKDHPSYRVNLTPEQKSDNQLYRFLEQPVYDKWGGFNGEYSVSGTLTWEVIKRTVTHSGEEEIPTWEKFEEEVHDDSE